MDATLRIEANELDRRRAKHFTRRPRTKLSAQRQRTVARAVIRAQAGDREAHRYLYLTFADNVYGYVRAIVHDDYEAEDITQGVFTKLMTAISRYREGSVPFSHWLLRLSHNAAVDYIRSSRAAPFEEIRGLDEEAEDALSERSRLLRAALETLPAEQREVVILRHVAGLTPTEIAARTGRTTSSIHGLHHRGRGALCAELRELEAAPVTRRVAA